MKVVAWFKDGSFYEVEIGDEKELSPMQAIAKAKEKLGAELLGEDRGHIESWTVEDDFI